MKMNAKIDWIRGAWSTRVGRYWTLGEVCLWDERRRIRDAKIQQNVIVLAAELDKLREKWGQPIYVNSWYRPPEINRQVGGAPDSLHLVGLAADVTPGKHDLDRFFDFVVDNWHGGIGDGRKYGFVHLDRSSPKLWWY